MDLAKLKALLGIEDDSKDMVLEFVIADVEEIIKTIAMWRKCRMD